MSVDPEVIEILKSWVSNAQKPPKTVTYGTPSKNSSTMTGWVIYSGSDAHSTSPYSSYHATPDLFLDQSGTAWDLVRSRQENRYLSASPAIFRKAHLGTYVTGDRNFLQRVVDERKPLEWHYMTIERDSSLDRADRYVPFMSLTRP